MLERFLEADVRDFDDITNWMDNDEKSTSSNDDFMRNVAAMMSDEIKFY